MKRTVGFTLTLIAAVTLLAALYAGARVTTVQAQGAAALDGKAIFLAQKCNMCHSVSTAGIEATTKSEKVKGPDLVNVKTDAATLTKYLKKQADVNGKKHAGAAWKGSDQELAALIAWIQKQKK
jgi:mono/diheme cytochrome c family protein